LAMLLMALDLAPGGQSGSPAALIVTSDSAQRASIWSSTVHQADQQAAQLAPTDVNNVWQSLTERPLRLPSVASGQPCPAVPGRTFTEGYGPGLGSGPVFLLLPGLNDATLRAEPLRGLGGFSAGSSGQQVRWIIHPLYHGPVLVRGARIDGDGVLRFNG